MFAITPNEIAEVYNRYRNDVDESELGFEDRWGILSDGQREKFLSEIEGYIDKRLCNIDEGPHRRTGWSGNQGPEVETVHIAMKLSKAGVNILATNPTPGMYYE